MEFSRIAAAGVELEGGWTDLPPGRMIGDGSISLRPGVRVEDGRIINYVGEIPSPPFSSPADMFAWMAQNYPQHTNGSCGMHVHTSFKSENSYVRIMDKSFFDYIREGMIAWGNATNIRDPNFFTRLEGANTYCRNEYNPMGQVRYKEKGPHRYSILNYCHGRYKTVELRALPLFGSLDTAIAAMTAYFEMVEAWLKKPPVGLKRIKKQVALEAEPNEGPVRDEATMQLDDLIVREELSIRVEDEYGIETMEV